MKHTAAIRKLEGFSLIELLIAMAVLGLLAAIAIPTYNGYMVASQESVARTNLRSLKLAEEAYFFEHNSYKAGKYDPAGGTDTLDIDTLGWRPDKDGNEFVYDVAAGACGDIAECFTITVSGFSGKVAVTE